MKAASGGLRSARRVLTGIGHSGPALTALGIAAVVVVAAVVIAVTKRTDAPRVTSAAEGIGSSSQQSGGDAATRQGGTAPVVPPGSAGSGAASTKSVPTDTGATNAGATRPGSANTGAATTGGPGSAAGRATTGSSGASGGTDTPAAARSTAGQDNRAANLPSVDANRYLVAEDGAAYGFFAASKNIYCTIVSNTETRCSIKSFTYSKPKTAIPTVPDKNRCSGPGVTSDPMVDVAGRVNLGCDEYGAPTGESLPDNRKLEAGGFTCTTLDGGVQCVGSKARKGFALSRNALTLYPDTASADTDDPSRAAKPAGSKTEIIQVDPLAAQGKLSPKFRVEKATLNTCVVSMVTARASGSVFKCGSSADYAPACWPKNDTTVWCMAAPTDTKVRESTVQSLSAVDRSPSGDTAPWQVQLADGTMCRHRIGGSWGDRSDGYLGVYFCSGDGGILVMPGQGGPRFDTSKPVWTAQQSDFGEAGRTPPRKTVKVVKAWYAGDRFPGIPKPKTPARGTVPANADATAIANLVGCQDIRPYDLGAGSELGREFLAPFGVRSSIKCTVQGQPMAILVIDNLKEYCQALVGLSQMAGDDASGYQAVTAGKWMIAADISDGRMPAALASSLTAKTGGALKSVAEIAAG